MSEQKYISINEAAASVPVARGTLWRWVKATNTPTFRVLGDRRTLIRVEDLERLREPAPAGGSRISATEASR
jgi:predicted DNA-binding protein (UPF0251 family)